MKWGIYRLRVSAGPDVGRGLCLVLSAEDDGFYFNGSKELLIDVATSKREVVHEVPKSISAVIHIRCTLSDSVSSYATFINEGCVGLVSSIMRSLSNDSKSLCEERTGK